VEEPLGEPEESPPGAPTLSQRVSQLEAAVQQLQSQVDALAAELARRAAGT
jgi:outer membrane murein-binding lipoprotein Lpp